MKQIDMIAWFNQDGNITPIKFRLPSEDEDEDIVVNVDHVVHRTMDRYAGNIMYVFECQSDINGTLRRYQIKLEAGKMKWFLHKM